MALEWLLLNSNFEDLSKRSLFAILSHILYSYFSTMILYSEFLFGCVFPDCRQSALELERLTEQRKQEEEAWYRQQKLLMEAEDQRRKMLEVEEKKLTDQRARSVDIIMMQNLMGCQIVNLIPRPIPRFSMLHTEDQH